MISPTYKFTSPKDMVGNKPVFSRERVVEMERNVKCIIPPIVYVQLFSCYISLVKLT